MALTSHLDATERASMFDALERAATHVGLALFVVHVDAATPTIVYASELLGDFVGRPTADLIGRPPWELVAAPEQERVREIIASRGPGAPPISLEFRIERPDGSEREIEVGVARITAPGAELAVCYFRDTTDERQAVEALRRSEARFRSLVELAPDGVVIVQAGRITLANPIAVEMFGAADLDSVRGRSLAEFLPAQDAERALDRIAQLHMGAEPRSSEYRLLANDLVVEVHSVPYEYDDQPAVLAFVRDVTERRRMQQQLFHADRLAALGTMAATVAHEINNPLTYLQLSLQRIEQELDRDPAGPPTAALREHVANALHGTERVARIVRDLRSHSRDDASEPEGPVDVVAVVERALEMVEHDLRHRARLVRRYPDEPAIVDAIAGRLEQVVINLLVNATQALEGKDPASDQVTVEIRLGTDVTIAITDTGAGIAERDRVFEPFFTTKPIGEGTGLGLAVCKQIVEAMRGRIELESVPGRGTRVAIALPRRLARPAAPPAPAAEVCERRLRILVIDDEPFVRHAMTALFVADHDVDDAGDGESALAMIGDAHYDVILCDLMMPHVNGRDVYQRVRARWPGRERRIVFVTGGAFIPALAGFLESVDNPKLRKPFTVEQALAVVHEAHRRS